MVIVKEGARSQREKEARGMTYKFQDQLPQLPIPDLDKTCDRYLKRLEPLQTPDDHANTRQAVSEFLRPGGDGRKLYEQLKDYAKDHYSYVEEFWDESYLSGSDPVVLNLNPFFILEDDPTPSRGSQLMRATSLILSSLGFVHDLRTGQLQPDTVRGTPLDMSQYERLFGTARIPTKSGCRMQVEPDSRHIVVLRHGQFYWFEVLDSHHRPVLTERELLSNLTAIAQDADSLFPHSSPPPPPSVSVPPAPGTPHIYQNYQQHDLHLPSVRHHHYRSADQLPQKSNVTAVQSLFPASAISFGVLSTENRKIWAGHRHHIEKTAKEARSGKVKKLSQGVSVEGVIENKRNLDIVDSALFVVCLDDSSPETPGEMCENALCGTYNLEKGVQVGTCTNRYYDKLQIIVAANGAAGVNFEHSGVDGHTVLRFVADVYTELILRFAKSINPAGTTLFKAPLSPWAKDAPGKKPKAKKNGGGNGDGDETEEEDSEEVDTTPKRLEWTLTPELKLGIRFAETRLGDLICQNEIKTLEFDVYGKNFITRHGFSPDAFVQMAFQAAYFLLYGRTECTYEPAMTKMFLHGRTEAIRSVSRESVEFVQAYCSDDSPRKKIEALRKACNTHTQLTKEASKGEGQDRLLYAMYCLFNKRLQEDQLNRKNPDGPMSITHRRSSSVTSDSSDTENGNSTVDESKVKDQLPSLFKDPGYATLNHSTISTSQCGNPALRLFGFGGVVADGFGIGYIIKESGLSFCASSKHLQTPRFLDTLEAYLREIQRLILHLYQEANRRTTETFIDHELGVVDSRTGKPIKMVNNTKGEDGDEGDDNQNRPTHEPLSGYGYFDQGELQTAISAKQKALRKQKTPIGTRLTLTDY